MTVTASPQSPSWPQPASCPSRLTLHTPRVIRSAFIPSRADRLLVYDTHRTRKARRPTCDHRRQSDPYGQTRPRASNAVTLSP
jgi:hypothetical protein